jgi:hypothetical protein
MRVVYRIWQSALLAVVLLSLLAANRVDAARLVPDPVLPNEIVRQFLAKNIAQPATLGEIKLTSKRLPLHVDLVCDAELILNENFYSVVPSSDRIFAPVSDRLAELKRAQAQLNLVPKDFVASLGGLKSSESLSFLKHTFVRTTVPSQARAHITNVLVRANHTERFFGGEWTLSLQSPALAEATWLGAPLAKFANPLPVDTPDFQRQLKAFLDTAKKTLDEVEEISNRYIAKADEDRAAVFRALPVGAVLSVQDKAAEGGPLFIEVTTADQKTGEIGFTVTSSFVSRPARTELLRGIHPDQASVLRAMLESRRQAEIEQTRPIVATVVVPESPATPNNSTPIEISAKHALEGEQSVQLSMDSGMPVLQVARIGKQISLQRIPEQEITSERARFESELGELSSTTEKGKIYRGTIDNTAYLLGVFSSEANGRVFILQREEEDAKPLKVEAELLDVERDHPALRLKGRHGESSLPDRFASMELAAKDSELIGTGRFGVVHFQSSAGKHILASGRIVTEEVAAFLEKLAQNSPGLYLYPESRFVPIPAAATPEQSAGAAFGSALLSFGTLGLGALPPATLHFPASAPITKLQRRGILYSLMLQGQFSALPLTKPKSDYVFVANRTNGVFAPRAQDFVSGLVAHELDIGIYSLSVSDVKEVGVFALVQSDSSGTRYYLVQIEL